MGWATRTSVDWTAEIDELLTERWLNGESASSIAVFIPGATRNSVIGRAGRLGLAGKGPKANRPAPGVSAPPKPTPAAKPAGKLVDLRKVRKTPAEHRAPPQVLTADQLVPTARPWTSRGAGECAWPIVVAGETLSCCAPAQDIYCPSHRAIAYTGGLVVDVNVRRNLRRYA